MGKYTALDHPALDVMIEGHIQGIVDAVTSRMQPKGIILRGSFGRGEGSVVIQGEQMRFLSDYEIDVVAISPFCRSVLREITTRLTNDFRVHTGLRWIRPDFFSKQRIGPFNVGPAPPTISLYESRYGSRTIYGIDILEIAPQIDPLKIRWDSALLLMLNRMAESMLYMSPDNSAAQDALENYYWINKTILACAEALLVVWGQYHYSYKERGERFAALAGEKLSFLPDGGRKLSTLVEAAIEFKLRPNPGLYPDSLEKTWRTVIPLVDLVFQYLVKVTLGIELEIYAAYPRLYLQKASHPRGWSAFSELFVSKLLEAYRSYKNRTFPPGLFSKNQIGLIVYAVVPLLFHCQMRDGCDETLRAARRWMKLLGHLDGPFMDLQVEKDYLRTKIIRYWEVYCRG